MRTLTILNLLTDEIAVVDTENAAFYTFKIESNDTGNEFYNLVVAMDEFNNIRSTRIFEYIPSDNWLQDTSQPFVGQVEVYENNLFSINDINSTFSLRGSNQCATGMDWEWVEIDCPDDCDCTACFDLLISVVYSPCPATIDQGDSGSGGGISFPVDGGNTGSGGGTSDGSSGNNNDNNGNPPADGENCILDNDGNCWNDETTPLPPPRDPIQNDQHIISLNEVVNIPKVKTELSRLKNNMGYSTQEDGKRFVYTGSDINDTSTYSDDNFNEESPTKKKSNSLSFPALQNNTLIGAHFHPDLDDSSPPKPIRKVPSGTDIAEHIIMVKKIAETNPTTSPEINQVTNFVVSKGNNGKTYAIRTNDEQSIVNLDGDFSKEGKERKVIAQELGKIILEINPSSPNVNTLQETAIANYITENFPGLSIYVAVYNTAGEIINWIKL
ncbi:hypothetical protein [Olleya sp. HaHaR_3_96]|uniref:hypothetical protein n=1 Tax=Olleya sp. HaHaR_3_96 TaxID=2745560 RepID=UPI001C4F4EE4|nr:hypothetical protein [Olleya sp. HaHaR_3_96]QXP60835.1 hypothetical protein H0I26_04140 [Olleya sp. HaHaR_3_96]